MKTHTTLTDANQTRASLHQLVEQITKALLPAANNHRNTIINSVPANLYANSNADTVAHIIRGMLHSLMINTTDSVIYVAAKEWYGRMVEVYIKDENCYNTYAVALSLQDMVPKAEAIGGHLDITNQKQKITTLSFRFPDGE